MAVVVDVVVVVAVVNVAPGDEMEAQRQPPASHLEMPNLARSSYFFQSQTSIQEFLNDLRNRTGK